jgi:hypothetical protein
MSDDLKEFLEKEQKSGIVNVNKLGLFFWERGGKQFVIECRKIYWNHKDRKNHYPSLIFWFAKLKSR